MLDSHAPIRTVKVSLTLIKLGQYYSGGLLGTPGNILMGSDIDAVQRQVDSVKFAPPPPSPLHSAVIRLRYRVAINQYLQSAPVGAKFNVCKAKIMQPYLLLALPVEPSRVPDHSSLLQTSSKIKM